MNHDVSRDVDAQSVQAPHHYEAARRLTRAQALFLAATDSERPIEIVVAGARVVGSSLLPLWRELIRVGPRVAMDCGFAGAIDGFRDVDRLARDAGLDTEWVATVRARARDWQN